MGVDVVARLGSGRRTQQQAALLRVARYSECMEGD